MLAIQTTDLGRRFGSVTAVDGLDLNVQSGAVYGFLGPNGAGKTTTIRLLLGLLRPDSGSVRLFDEAPGRGGRPLRRSLARTGALVESPSLYPHLTGRENLEATRRLLAVPTARIDEVLETVQMTIAADRPVKGYSHGMRQRLGLALALLPAPDLLILDEPTNGLDPAGIRETRELVREMPARHGLTVFLSSHLLGEVEQVASHVGIIDNGRLLWEGPLADLQATSRPSVLLGVTDPGAARACLAAAGWSSSIDECSRLTVEAAGDTDAAALNALLVSAGHQVHHVSVASPTLEEIFLGLTGNEVRP